jgi:predicted nucleotidyltransferase
MTVSSYLKKLSDGAIIRDTEKASIKRSIVMLKSRVEKYFGDSVREKLIFGSYTRNTILPRLMDEKSDIDYMVLFESDGVTPQSYLNRLKCFIENYYSTSEIKQDHPTIKLNLNHITFELVPALEGFWGGYKIPSKTDGIDDWISTSPNGFNTELTDKNTNHGYLIKPLTRLVKYWNAQNGYVFESYSLEQDIVNYSFNGTGFFSTPDLKSYFYEFMLDLSLSWNAPQWKKDKLSRAKTILKNVKNYEWQDQPYNAENEIKKLLPDPFVSKGLAATILGSR